MFHKIAIRISFLFLVLEALLLFVCFYQPAIPADKPVVAVLYGYNFFLKDSSTAYVYVERVLPYLRQCRNLELIIVSGGVTRPTERPHESEAGLMRQALVNYGVTVPIIDEDKAHTTLENAIFTGMILKNRGVTKDVQIVVFSEQFHRLEAFPASLVGLQGYSTRHIGIDLLTEYDKILRLSAKRPAR